LIVHLGLDDVLDFLYGQFRVLERQADQPVKLARNLSPPRFKIGLTGLLPFLLASFGFL
jgi:hypothetical protein